MIPFLFIIIFSFLTTAAGAQTETGPELTILAPGVISLPDIRETSPSITADGQTLVFARTENWKDKVPYIATREDGEDWSVERLLFTDTLYNLAISPDGQTIFFKKYEPYGDTTISRAYRVDRSGAGWGQPRNLKKLEDINAGYFCPMPDGALYLFARKPKPGIYRSEPRPNGGYGEPVYLSDAVSIPNTTSFDVLMHPDEDRLIITRAGIPGEKAEELGPRGYYLYEKDKGEWREVERLPLPYGWGATFIPGGKLLFVEDGDLQFVALSEIGVNWD